MKKNIFINFILNLPLGIYKCSFKTSLIVGSFLTIINQGDVLMGSDINFKKILQISLCYMVPFFVSFVSQVALLRDKKAGSINYPKTKTIDDIDSKININSSFTDSRLYKEEGKKFFKNN